MPVESDRCVSVCVMPARWEIAALRLFAVAASIWFSPVGPATRQSAEGLQKVTGNTVSNRMLLASTVTARRQMPAEERPTIDNRQVKCTILLRKESAEFWTPNRHCSGPGPRIQQSRRKEARSDAALERGRRGGSCLRPGQHELTSSGFRVTSRSTCPSLDSNSEPPWPNSFYFYPT